MLIKIQTVRPTYFNSGDDVKFENHYLKFINPDKIIRIDPYASVWEIQLEGDRSPEDGYQHHFTLISDAEMQRVASLLLGEPAPVVLPAMNMQEFDALMLQWYEAKKTVQTFGENRHVWMDMEAESQAYRAVIGYIAKTQPPTIAAQTIPDDVNKAHADLAEVLTDTWSMEELYDASYALSKALNKYVSKQETSS